MKNFLLGYFCASRAERGQGRRDYSVINPLELWGVLAVWCIFILAIIGTSVAIDFVCENRAKTEIYRVSNIQEEHKMKNVSNYNKADYTVLSFDVVRFNGIYDEDTKQMTYSFRTNDNTDFCLENGDMVKYNTYTREYSKIDVVDWVKWSKNGR